MTAPAPAIDASAVPAPRSARPLWVAWLACALLIAVAARGVWPIVPVEGDDQGVLFGIDGMRQSSPDLLARRYLYDVQPGSYQVLAALAGCTGASAETVFAFTTVLGAILFAVSSAWLLSLALSIPFVYGFLAILWCQETVTAACYLNTTALAGGAALLALIPFARASTLPRVALGGFGLGVAGWLRGDALLVAPVALALLSSQHGFGSRALRKTSVAALVAVTTFAVLHALADAPLAAALGTFGRMPHDVATLRTTRDAILTLLSPALLLLAIAGAVWLAVSRNFSLLTLALAGIVPTLLAYRGVLVTTKYLYYTLPFALLPALALLRGLFARASRWPWRRRAWAAGSILLVAAADLTAGVRVLRGEIRYLATPPAAASASLALGGRSIEITLGGGDPVPNEDGFRLRTGHLFAPAAWHREKMHQFEQLGHLRTSLARGGDRTIYFAAWLPEQMVSRELFAAGFKPERTGEFTRWRRNRQIVDAHFLAHASSSDQPTRLAPAPDFADECLFVGLFGGKIPPRELADGRRWRAISVPSEGFITIYRRD